MSVTKIFTALVLAAFACSALAQDPDPTRPRLRPTAPQPVEEERKTPPLPPDEIELIPEAPPEPVKKPKGEALKQPAEKLDRTTAAENEMASRVRLRELTIRVKQEPKVVAEWDRAQAAKTDYEKREALKAYYKMLYERVLKIDPSLEKRVMEIRSKALHRLAETRVDPTEPIDPTERGSRRE